MKYIFFLFFSFFLSAANAQFVATMELKEKVPGICDMTKVYVLFAGFDGQKEAKCPLTKEEIMARLNQEVQYVKDNPKFKGEGMVRVLINCEGKVVQCEMDNETKSKELDAQIVAVLNSMGEWKPGKLNGSEVDSAFLFSFKIKKGVFIDPYK
jgi:hypothetical protein